MCAARCAKTENFYYRLGRIQYASKLDDGLELYRVTCPIGVVMVIFEARPEVIVNIACLSVKTGNACILKGGKEANFTAKALQDAITEALTSLQEIESIKPAAVQIISSREQVSALLAADEYIDLVIPRGGKSLVKYIQSNTRWVLFGCLHLMGSLYESPYITK